MSKSLLLRACLSAVLLSVILGAAVCEAAAATQPYEIQRRMGSEGEWATIASFTFSRATAQSVPRLKNMVPADKDLSKDEKAALTSSDMIYYRVLAEGKPAAPSAMVAITPCSIIRGFEAVDSTTVVLREKLRLAPGPGTSIVGIQVTSETNFFHSKMIHGDECDLSVVQKLFPTVRVKVEVGLLPSVELVSKVNYAELRALSADDAERGTNDRKAQKKKAKKVQVRRVKNAEGEWVEEEVEVDERSFMEKYWVYIVGMIVMSIIQNVVKK